MHFNFLSIGEKHLMWMQKDLKEGRIYDFVYEIFLLFSKKLIFLCDPSRENRPVIFSPFASTKSHKTVYFLKVEYLSLIIQKQTLVKGGYIIN